MKAFYILFLLSALILTNPTSANASPLEKKWNKECCPVSACVFTEGVMFAGGPPNYRKNTFNGILSFTESPKNKLQISGFIDIDGVTTNTIGDFPNWDLHVAPCDTANSAQPGDIGGSSTGTIDLDSFFFDKPILTDSAVLGLGPISIDKIKGQCCFVVNEFALGVNEFILGIAPVVPVVECDHPPVPYSSSSSYYSAPTPTPSANSTS
jgi:hypothetical protein